MKLNKILLLTINWSNSAKSEELLLNKSVVHYYAAINLSQEEK